MVTNKPQITAERGLISSQRVMALLNISPITWHRWTRRAKLRGVRMGSSALLYDVVEVAAVVDRIVPQGDSWALPDARTRHQRRSVPHTPGRKGGRPPKFDDEQCEEIVAMFDDGWTVADLCRNFKAGRFAILAAIARGQR